jgi:hypothetical protein
LRVGQDALLTREREQLLARPDLQLVSLRQRAIAFAAELLRELGGPNVVLGHPPGKEHALLSVQRQGQVLGGQRPDLKQGFKRHTRRASH